MSPLVSQAVRRLAEAAAAAFVAVLAEQAALELWDRAFGSGDEGPDE